MRRKNYNEKWGFPSFARNFFLNLYTFKSYDLIDYQDSCRDLSKCFKTITLLQGYIFPQVMSAELLERDQLVVTDDNHTGIQDSH